MPPYIIPTPASPLSNSASGDSYTGLGCFPLGHHITSSKVSDLVLALRHLRESKLLHALSSSATENMHSKCDLLKTAEVFWSHTRDIRQPSAINELCELIFSGAPYAPELKHLEIYLFPDSTLLSCAVATQVWGLYELDAHTRKTILYVSERQQRELAGVVLHTFMSSRGCARLQCFAAEYVLADQARKLTGEWGLPVRLQEDVDMLEEGGRRALAERLGSESMLGAPILLAKLGLYCEKGGGKRTTPESGYGSE